MKEYLKKISSGERLSEEESFSLFNSFMGEGNSAPTDAQIGAYLMSTSSCSFSPGELTGAVRSLRKHMLRVALPPGLNTADSIDTCGTGGSGLNTFNTSTASAFVLAGGGLVVAKHGNRSATSKCGSADVLEALGIKIDLSPEAVAHCIRETGFGFMFAPLFHPATKRAQLIRRELGFRTIFNFLGPLCNPAGVQFQVLGVGSAEVLSLVAESLRRLGTKRALIVHGEDGLDEVTLTGRTQVVELREGELRNYSLSAEDFGLRTVSISAIEGAEPKEAAALLRQVLEGKNGAYRDIVTANAAAGFYVAGASASLLEGVKRAELSIDSGRAAEVLSRVIEVSKGL